MASRPLGIDSGEAGRGLPCRKGFLGPRSPRDSRDFGQDSAQSGTGRAGRGRRSPSAPRALRSPPGGSAATGAGCRHQQRRLHLFCPLGTRLVRLRNRRVPAHSQESVCSLGLHSDSWGRPQPASRGPRSQVGSSARPAAVPAPLPGAPRSALKHLCLRSARSRGPESLESLGSLRKAFPSRVAGCWRSGGRPVWQRRGRCGCGCSRAAPRAPGRGGPACRARRPGRARRYPASRAH